MTSGVTWMSSPAPVFSPAVHLLSDAVGVLTLKSAMAAPTDTNGDHLRLHHGSVKFGPNLRSNAIRAGIFKFASSNGCRKGVESVKERKVMSTSPQEFRL